MGPSRPTALPRLPTTSSIHQHGLILNLRGSSVGARICFSAVLHIGVYMFVHDPTEQFGEIVVIIVFFFAVLCGLFLFIGGTHNFGRLFRQWLLQVVAVILLTALGCDGFLSEVLKKACSLCFALLCQCSPTSFSRTFSRSGA